ncbi:hypothetical protein FHL15_007759 [Xylaria flabelliformis]|uniref:HNH nuclease domain-containing protein n=1 Tax=Xylaria flabelliformis TaxID=2512241 RepID=A0A553HTT2_9PEZI|nr:hypothetical protein FHL15_007759 [Xylaria flabelliformis]
MACPLLKNLRGLPDESPKLDKVSILHPGYNTYECNVIFELAAVDCVERSSQVKTWGVHHGTVLIVGAIVVNNAFGRVYLSHDRFGKTRVQTTKDSLLEPGRYWLQLKGHEPFLGLPGDKGNTEPRVAGGRTPRSSSPVSAVSTPVDDKHHKYPIVPSFSTWKFPHDNLPEEWKLRHEPPRLEQDLELAPEATRCCITKSQLAVEDFHLIPSDKQQWFRHNGMKRYCHIGTGQKYAIDDNRNIVRLSSNFHRLFDQRLFVIAPKPVTVSPDPPSSDPQPPTSTAKDRSYAFAVHVLNNDGAAREFAQSYHNVPIHTQYRKGICREFLFARFAYNVFPLLRDFFNPELPREVIVYKENMHSTESWTSKQYEDYLADKGESIARCHIGSKKRRAGSGSQNEDDDDAYFWHEEHDWEDINRARPRHKSMSESDSTSEDELRFKFTSIKK